MNIEIRKLSPDLAEDYVRFFDETPHSERPEKFKCYCVCWGGGNHHALNRSFLSSEEVRRKCAVKYVKKSILQGYLAYCDGRVVGWCNANTKADCLKCFSWRMSMGTVPTGDADKKVKSVLCFAIAPEMRRHGVAGLLLERVCRDAAREGFDYAEGYPRKAFANGPKGHRGREADDFMGPAELFGKCGFGVHCEAGDRLVMRKKL